MTAGSPARRRIGGSAAVARRHRGGARRHRGRLQNRPADPLAHRFCQDRRDPRCAGRVFCFGHPAVQHDDLDGAPDAEHSVVLCAVRARGHRRAYPRQDRRFEKEGDVDGRGAAAGYRVRDWRLVIVDGEAEIVRTIFRRYAELGSVPVVEGGGRGPRDQKQVVDERFGSPHPASGSGRFYSVLSPPFGNRAQLSQHRNGPTKPVLTGRHGVADDAMPCRRPRSRASNRCKRAPIAG